MLICFHFSAGLKASKFCICLVRKVHQWFCTHCHIFTQIRILLLVTYVVCYSKREYEPPVQREYSLRPRGVIKSYAVPNEDDDLLSLPSTRRSIAPRRAPVNPNKRGITSVTSTTDVSDWVSTECRLM